MDDAKLQEAEMAAARQMMDGKLVKKTRPRRTVDYTGGVGRWGLVSYHQYHISSSIMHNVYPHSYENSVQIQHMYPT